MEKIKQIVEKMGVCDVEEIQEEYLAFSFFYKSDNLKVKGFIIFPKIIEGKVPVVFVNRGGTGESGKTTNEHIKNFSFFAKSGYIVVSTQYRGVDGGEGFDRMGGDDVYDIANLYEYIVKIPFADLERIVMWGVSRGGMMTFQVLARVSWVKVAVVVSPLIDEVHMASWRPGWREHQVETYGGSYIEQIKRSPIYWVDQIPKIPILMFAGMKDDKTDPHKTIEMAKKIGAELVVFEEEGHKISGKSVSGSIEFFKKHL